VIIPTLERPSLKEAKSTLEAQTLKPEKILYMTGPGDPVTKIKAALKQTETEFVAIADDDIHYPPQWLAAMMEVMKSDDKVGFVGGTMLPMSALKPKEATDSEKRIAKVLGSFFGTTNMSQRVKIKNKVEARDETNMVGAGLARTALVRQVFDEEIISSFHDTYMVYRINALGYRTMYAPDAYFYHATRTSLIGFALQMLRVGSGRMGFFRQYPSQALRKFYILFPMFFVLYLLAFFVLNWFNLAVVSGLPLTAYVALNFGVSYYQKDLHLTYYYLTMHFFYGVGLLLGLFRSVKTWK